MDAPSKRQRRATQRYEPVEQLRMTTRAKQASRSDAAAAREAAREQRAARVLALHAPHTQELSSAGWPSGTHAIVRHGPGLPQALRSSIMEALVGAGKLIPPADDPSWEVRCRLKNTRARAPFSPPPLLHRRLISTSTRL